MDTDTRAAWAEEGPSEDTATCEVRSLEKNNLASRSEEINCCCLGHLVAVVCSGSPSGSAQDLDVLACISSLLILLTIYFV